ncbi:hypothetical protein [Glycomyces xiaoerkulensis]|uniref:hypothetical protein n=1 Tax=Glycomyces xiaoerkulensis TaxID=2038139 RepID=UPI000C269311|nr:hypothetical protein [Glycomyces xiaoerkulensis]
MSQQRSLCRVRVLGAAVLAAPAVFLAGCVNEVKPKSEAIDDVIVLGDRAAEELEGTGIGAVDFLDAVDEACETDEDEPAMYRMVARYTVDIEPVASVSTMRTIRNHWVDELGYQELDDGIYWGRSGYAVVRAGRGDVVYSATRHPDHGTVTISVDSGCIEDPDPEDRFDPVAPAAS